MIATMTDLIAAFRAGGHDRRREVVETALEELAVRTICNDADGQRSRKHGRIRTVR